MDFNLSEEQGMIRDSLVRFVAENYDLTKRAAIAEMDHGFSAENWQQFAELGWLSIPFAEEHEGFGGGPIDTMVIMQELGRGNVLEPFLPTVVLFGGLLQAAAPDSVKAELIPQIIAGELQGALAFVERQSRYVMSDIATSAKQDGDSWVINGSKVVVLNGAAADKIIVAARTAGDQADEHGITLFLIDGNAPGLDRHALRMTDGREAANLELNNVKAEAVIGAVGEGFATMQPIIDNGILAVSAEALGAMEFLNATTLEYAKTRKQFGQPIGSFQALQHRMVDMFAAAENTKSLLYRAVCAADAGSDDAERSLLALKVMVGRAGRHIGSEAIQLHGGMGMTNEMPVGHYVKRLMIINTLFGDADYHQQRFIARANAPLSGDSRSTAQAA